MTLSWFSIVRLGLVQMCIGSIVVLMTSTLNRLMVVELALPAILPGFLVALHYGVQLSRPNWGYLSDIGGSRRPWIIIGMLMLSGGAILATAALAVFDQSYALALSLSILAYTVIGFGVGACGTSLLALLAIYTADHRRAAAATITWLMMIFGIALTAGVVGAILDPYSHSKLMVIVGGLCGGLSLLTILATWRIEKGLQVQRQQERSAGLIAGVKEVWQEPAARQFTIFVFLSMVAYFMQELILEPFSGLVFYFTPGQSTSLSGVQNGGVFMGMLCVGILATGFRIGHLRQWVILGCSGSALALWMIAASSLWPTMAPLGVLVGALGFFNGVFAVSAIGTMMALANEGREKRAGTRMGLWGAAQAIAAAVGGLSGAALVDILRGVGVETATAFAMVFIFEGGLFIWAAFYAKFASLYTLQNSEQKPKAIPGE